MEGNNSSSSGQRASHGHCQGGVECGHRDRHARHRAGGVYSRSASPIEMQHADMPVIAPHQGITVLVPLEEVVIEPRCSPGSPGVEFVEGSSEDKVGGLPSMFLPLHQWTGMWWLTRWQRVPMIVIVSTRTPWRT
jgi:hypothetical protein